MNTAESIIEKLKLQPHPEGGYFKEVYRSDDVITADALPEAFKTERNYSTSIYFLLTSENFSAFHKINQEEIWHFYDGSPLLLYMISPSGELSEVTIGRNLEKGEKPQFVVPRNYWFAAKVIQHNQFSFVGCTVAPGFDFEDFTLAERDHLTSEFPQHKEIIAEFTRN
ncbi:cupin domain-containing protein [Zunongwangia endophytica]|uniref:Cupin domain-containing protein n=1 Tax=Zunongwangia endophytica TaxID=1808945 RepID=A0ABV8H7W7_9FLAO|nr:cupin domain-containing protein [Zunongwangia endophytica]MDN3593617.1 cupin domain-containing protein [Zunongwangia endophytica]